VNTWTIAAVLLFCAVRVLMVYHYGDDD